MALRILRSIFKLILRIIANVEVHGMEKIPKTGGCIAASNHLGRLDVLLVYTVLDRTDVIVIAAEKYHKYFLWRWIGKQLNAIWVDRFGADFKTIREVLKRIRAGELFTVAPEGTRSKREKMNEGRPGAAYLAAKSGVPVVPVGLTGTQDRLVRERLLRFKRLHIVARVGDPFVLPELPVEDRDAVLQEYTDEIMVRIAALLPEEYRGFYSDHPRLNEIKQSIGDPFYL